MHIRKTTILIAIAIILSIPSLTCCVAVVTNGSTLALKGLPRAELEKKAEAGDAQAQYELGLANCCMGPGFSTQVATEWLCKAAHQGHPDAMYELGRIYMGDISRTPALGQKLRRLAVAKESQPHAYMWLFLAKKNGHEKAIEKLSKLEESISLANKESAVILFYDRKNAACEYDEVFAEETKNDKTGQ